MKRDEKGRVIQRVPGEYSDRVFSFRVTADEYELIQKARKQGIKPRELLLTELRKRVKIEKG